MTCEICKMELVINEIYNLTGISLCEGCSANFIPNPNTATYLGIYGNHHVFILTHHQKCKTCGGNMVKAKIPCGETLADVLFSKVEVFEQASL